jgi:decaprenyl-phosphate phosphoribosyltransferase
VADKNETRASAGGSDPAEDHESRAGATQDAAVDIVESTELSDTGAPTEDPVTDKVAQDGLVASEETPAPPSAPSTSEQKKAGTASGLVSGLVREARPKQWVKNILVLAVPFLAGKIAEPSVLLDAALAFVVFSMAASGIYFVNDAKDVEADRAHPTKCNRPIAAGLVPLPIAYVVATGLLVGSIGISLLVSQMLAVVMAVYIVVQLGYCFGLKHQPVIDMCIVSSGFLLRIIAGGAAANLPISQWFMLVTAFGSLFMVAGKRYAEIILAEKTGAKIRKSLEGYSASYLRFVWAISAAIVITTYALWAYQQHDISSIWSTVSIVPFVVAILRYAVDVDKGTAGEPEEVVLKDKVLIVLGAAVAGCMLMAFYF